MRVHERGVGETRSCGTGTVAATAAALADQGAYDRIAGVRVPGGEVSVEITDTTSFLRGPSVLVAHGDLSDRWWADWSGRECGADVNEVREVVPA